MSQRDPSTMINMVRRLGSGRGNLRALLDSNTHVAVRPSVGTSISPPAFSAVPIPHHFHEHADHADFFTAHFDKKGAEVANACSTALASLATIK